MAKGQFALEGVIKSQLIHNLEELPPPDWSDFPIHAYDYRPLLKPKPVLPMLTSRGCSFDCSYCPYMVMQTKMFRTNPIARVLDELGDALQRHGIKSVVFRDIIFTLNKKRIAQLCDGILARGYKFQWSCETRADCLDEVLLGKMRAAGLEVVHLGIESPEDEVVKKSGRKPIKESHQEKIIQYCNNLGVKVAGFFILGFFDDNHETMRKTLDYAKYLNTTMAQFDVMTPYPGTRFYEQHKDRVATEDWKRFNNYTSVLRLDYLTPGEVMSFKDRAYREYYLRWDWLVKNGWKVLWQ